MAKKRADTTKVANELRGSAFFQGTEPAEVKPAAVLSPASVKEPVVEPMSTSTPNDQPGERSSGQSDARAGVRPAARTPVRSVTRYAFEFYFDQIDELKQRSLEDRIQGGSGNMSQMVRQAVDEYLNKHPREEA